MFKRFIPLFLLSSLFLYAEQVELYATKIDNDENRTIAEGDTYMIRKDSTIKADILYYDKLHKTIEAYGNIFITQKNNSYTLTDYIFMDMDKKYTVLDKLEKRRRFIRSKQPVFPAAIPRNRTGLSVLVPGRMMKKTSGSIFTIPLFMPGGSRFFISLILESPLRPNGAAVC